MRIINVPFAAVKLASIILQKEGRSFRTAFIILDLN